MALAGLAVLGADTAAAAGLFSPGQVAEGVPAGTAVFGQTDPCRVLNPDDGSHCCTVSKPPADEVTDANGNPAYLGTKEVVAIDGVVAGGCIGLDQAGMTCDGYIGQAAVAHEIISREFLGEPVLGPGRGEATDPRDRTERPGFRRAVRCPRAPAGSFVTCRGPASTTIGP